MTSKAQEKISRPVVRSSDEITTGIDISKEHLHFDLHPEGIARQFTNEPKSGSSMIANAVTILEFCPNDTSKPRCFPCWPATGDTRMSPRYAAIQ